jgi:hypothetical protein
VYGLLFAVLIIGLLVGLPLLGAWLTGLPLAPFLEFPPRMTGVEHAAFSWAVFLGLAVAIMATVMPFIVRLILSARSGCPSGTTPHKSFPWWGWLGVAWTVSAWVLAWARFDWMTAFQTFTFTPLWLGYIMVANAWTERRGGESLLQKRPGSFAALFLVSAALWWYFEYLNRFVQNWYYAGGAELTATEYMVQATIPFSTVLPAFASTHRLLETFPSLSYGLDRGPVLRILQARRWSLVALLLAGLGLMGLGRWPNELFPLVWLAPLAVIVCLQALAGQKTIFAPLRRGNWRPLWTASLASLVCGFFWEFWNWRSLAHWTYSIPYVDRYHIFAMPLLGYAGYLPFGLECAVIADWVLKILQRQSRQLSQNGQ